MSPSRSATLLVCERFPRVSGDEPIWNSVKSVVAKFSPRERG